MAVSISAIVDPAPEPAEPVTADETEVHVNVVPATPFGLVIKTFEVVLEQIVWLVAKASGAGSTVTTATTGVPGHPPADGVIV